MTTIDLVTSAATAASTQVPRPADAHNPPKIVVRDFNFFYGEAKVLHGIELDIPEKQVTALIGPSGCGKSTFLRSINRMNDIIPGARVEAHGVLHARAARRIRGDEHDLHEPSGKND